MALWDCDFIARSSIHMIAPSSSSLVTAATRVLAEASHVALVGSDSDETMNVDLRINEADPEVRGISTVV